MRSMNGHNDNPIASQFISAYKKLLHQSDITISQQSNVDSQCTSNILTISSRCTTSKHQSEDENETNAAEVVEVDYNLEDWCEHLEFELLQNNSWSGNIQDSGIAYAANLLEQRLTTSKQIYCGLCRDVLMNNEKVDDAICVSYHNNKPCLSTYQLCKAADAAIEMYINTGSNLQKKVQNAVLKMIPFENIFPEFYEPLHDVDHKHFLVKFIIDEYINKNCSYIAKQKTIDSQTKYIRNKLRKIGHQMHQ